MAQFPQDVANNAGTRANKRYQRTYRRSVSQNRNVQTFGDYLSPIPPAQLGRMARQQVTSQIQPVLQQINQMFGRQRQQGVADIAGASAGLGRAAAAYGPQVQRTDDAMLRGQELLDAGIRSFLADAGQKVVGGVTAQQQAAGAPSEALQATAAGPGQLALGVQGEALGRGASTLSQMLTQRAADVTHAQFMPTIAGRAQQQDTASYLRNLATQQSTALGDVTSKVPGLVSSTYQNLYQQEINKAIARQGFQMDQAKLTAAQTAGSQHLQFKSIKNPDGSITYGSYDPSTGGFIPSWTADAPIGGKNKDFQKRVDKVNDIARKLSSALYSGGQVTATGGTLQEQLQSAIASSLAGGGKKKTPTANRKAYMQVIAIYDQAFPNQPDTWKLNQARLSLIAGGYAKADIALRDPKTFAQIMAPQVRVSSRGGQQGGRGGPEGPVGTPGTRQPRAPGATGPVGQQQKTNAKQAAQKATATSAVQRNALTEAQRIVGHEASQPPEYKQNPINWLTRYITTKYPLIGPAEARAIARQAVSGR